MILEEKIAEAIRQEAQAAAEEREGLRKLLSAVIEKIRIEVKRAAR